MNEVVRRVSQHLWRFYGKEMSRKVMLMLNQRLRIIHSGTSWILVITLCNFFMKLLLFVSRFCLSIANENSGKCPAKPRFQQRVFFNNSKCVGVVDVSMTKCQIFVNILFIQLKLNKFAKKSNTHLASFSNPQVKTCPTLKEVHEINLYRRRKTCVLSSFLSLVYKKFCCIPLVTTNNTVMK